MDLGIRGRAPSYARPARAWAAPARGAWPRTASSWSSTPVVARRWRAHARRDPRRPRRRGHRGGGRRRHRGRPCRIARGLPRARHPGQQCRRPTARRFPRLGRGGVACGPARQHAGADRADPGRRRHDGGARLRPDRQHHLGGGEGADPGARPVQRCPRRAHRLVGRGRAAGRGQGRDHQQHPAGPVRDRPAARPTSPPAPSGAGD